MEARVTRLIEIMQTSKQYDFISLAAFQIGEIAKEIPDFCVK